jgi:hypothetical protein
MLYQEKSVNPGRNKRNKESIRELKFSKTKLGLGKKQLIRQICKNSKTQNLSPE